MQFSYNALVRKADAYLREQRAANRFLRAILPLRLFDEHLWLWERRSVAVGLGWGVAWAIAPVPLQTIFAALCSLWRRGNIPVSVAACWVSFPGYQVFAWPLQWWVGSTILNAMGIGSRTTWETIRDAAVLLVDGWDAVLPALQGIELPLLAAELLLGCLVTCVLAGLGAYGLTLLVWRPKKAQSRAL